MNMDIQWIHALVVPKHWEISECYANNISYTIVEGGRYNKSAIKCDAYKEQISRDYAI